MTKVFSAQDLKMVLQRIQKDYAYEMLALEINIETENMLNNKEKAQSITKLTQLYMMAVETLECTSDLRYKFFNSKIQNLMKKRYVIEEIFKSNTTHHKPDVKTMKALTKAEITERKEDLEFRVCLNKDQIDSRKIKEMVKTAENKLKTIETKIKTGIRTQEDKITQRIRQRRQKSQSSSRSGSIERIKVIGLESAKLRLNTDSDHESKAKNRFDQYFNEPEIPRKRKGSQSAENTEAKTHLTLNIH